MSTKVDERVVEMRFDNKQFESGVADTMSTLDKLKQKLQFKDATKGFTDIEKAANKTDLSPLGKAAEQVSLKFSAMEVASIAAITNITNSAVNMGKQLVKSLSIDQITAGWAKFGNKTTSVATLQAQGYALETVNEQLDRLNWFTDETSYEYVEMANNIAKFTATGKGLEESVTAMEGIANWAALSGQNATTASHAMYQLSQAMGAGVMRLEDYKSIQNASMDTDEFRQKALDAAVALGTLKQNADGTYQSLVAKSDAFTKTQFTTQLTKGEWFTSDVMMKVFDDYSKAVSTIYDVTAETGKLTSDVLDEIHDKADELKTDTMSDDEAINAAIKELGYTLEDGSLKFDAFSLKAFEAGQKARTWGDAVDSVKDAVSTGWMNTFEIIFGNSEEATELWTDLANAMWDVFAAGGEARNELLEGWKDLGGRDAIIESFWNVWDAISSIVTPVKEAFREIFPATTAEQLNNMSTKLQEVTAKFKELTEKNAPQLKATFKGIFSVISVGVKIVKTITKAITILIGKLTGFSGGILDITGGIGNFVTRMSDGINEANLFGKAINGITSFLGGAIDAFREFTGAIKEKVTANGFEWFFELMQKIGDVIQRVAKAVGTVAAAIGKALGDAFRNGDFKSLLDILNGGIFASILLGINKIINRIKGAKGSDITKSLFGTITELPGKISDVLDSVKDSLKSWQNELQSKTIKNLAIAIGILAAALWVLSGIDSDKMGTALAGMGTLMLELMGALFLFTKITADAKSALKGMPALIAIAAAIFILASALKKLSDLDWKQLGVGLAGVAGLMLIATGAILAISKFASTSEKSFKITKNGIFSSKSKKNMISIGLAMIAMAAAVKILASACKDLSGLNWTELGVGLTGIVILLGSVTGAMIALSNFTSISEKASKNGALNSKSQQGLMTIGLAMIAMAAAMKILASACKDLSGLNWDELKVGLTGIVVMLGVVTGAMIALSRFTSKTGEVFNQSEKGMFSSKSKQNLISIGLSMIAIAAAMKIMASAATDFAEMEWPDLGKAGAAITGILGLTTGFLLLAGKAKNMKQTVGSLLIIAATMEIFAHVAGVFGNMEWPDLGKAGAAITGILGLVLAFSALAGNVEGDMMASAIALLVVAAALLVLTPVIKTLGSMSLGQVVIALVALAGGLAIFIGAAVLIDKFNLTPALCSLAGSIALLGLACLAAGAGIALFAAGFTALAAAGAAGATSFVAAITIIIVGILNLIPSIVDQITAAIVAICNVIIQSAPAIGKALKELVLLAIDVLVECIPALAEGILQLLVTVMTLLVQYTPQIIDLLVDFILVVVNGLAARLPELMAAVANLIVTLINGLAEHVPEFVEAGINLFGAVIEGIASAIGPIIEAIIAPMAEVFGNILIGIAEVIAPYMPSIIEGVGTMVDLICNGISRIITALGPLEPYITQIVEAISNAYVQIMPYITRIVEGILSAIVQIVQAIAPVLQTLLEQISPIIDSITGLVQGLGDAIADIGEGIRDTLEGLAGVFDSAFGGIADVINSVGDTIEKFLNGIANIIDSVGEAALNSGTGFEKLADGIATITHLNLADMAASLAAVGVGLGKIVAESAGISDVGTAMANIANGTKIAKDSFDSIASGVSTIVSSFSQVSEAAKTVTATMTETFTNAKEPIVSAITSTMTACTDTINAQYDSFYSAASYLVDGFVKGISENTFKAEAEAKAMAETALEAAREKLKVNSPSKEFMKVGGSVVEGLVKGIAKNVGTSNKASVKMANGVLTSFQEELGIHSPSLVMNKQGRYIVQGIAEGITKDMSAEEAAEKKAQNIVNAFQEALDNYDRGISNRGKDFDLWQLSDGKTASTVEVLQKQKQKLSEDLADYNKQVQLNTDKWQQLKDTFGENNKATQEAYGAMRDSQITAAQIAADYIAIDKSIIASQEETLDSWKTINENGLEIMELERSNGYLVSDKYKDSRFIEVYTDNLNIAKTKMDNAEKEYSDTLAEYNNDMNHSAVQEARKKYLEAWINWLNEMKTLSDYEDSIFDREIEEVEKRRSHREDVIDRWEATYGDNATAKQRYLFYKNTYENEANDLWKEYRVYLKEYEDFVEELAEKNGITVEEAKKTQEAADLYNDTVYPAETAAMEADNKVSDLRKDHLEQQKEDLKDQYETASDIADIKYQIWELTTGRDATDAEKETMKLAVLTEQLGNQAKLVNMAKEAWENAKEDEKLQKETEYWNARLELAQLQSDVLDIQESITKRQKSALDKQRLAQDEYEDYVKQYQKYYLDHGMSLADLERDAKLVSGYDPDKVTTSAVNKTQSAIDNIQTNVTNLTKAIGEGIQNGVTDITTSTTDMLDSCADVLSAEKDTWFKAGAGLVDGLVEGITSKVQTAVESVTDLVTRMLEAMQFTIENGMNFSSGITPVVDMSDITSQSTLSGIRSSGLASYNLAKSIAQSKADTTSVTPVATQSSAPVYSFTQNNYSPKALSAVEIYRQTNNMVSRIGKKVNI